jgi:tetratricopeptide (TPR) repeat protein
MNQPFLIRHIPHLLVLAVSTLALHQSAHALDLNRRLDVQVDASEVVQGITAYHFYQGNSFAALNTILAAKAIGRIDDSITSSEVLLGDLYTAFGMPDEADNTFSRVMTRDMRTQTRNETLFRKAKLQYSQGNYFEAERILNTPLDTLITPIEAERRVLLANIFMARNEYIEARNLLSPIPLDTPMGAYATYNAGVTHLRADRSPEGVRLLEKVMNLPVGDTETNALKDRAALAIGYNYLQTQDAGKAREALLNVRLKGPFSNSAMLALGFANYERKDYKRALSFWLELLTRNTSDPSVQEAMLLAPRAYEALNATQQAFYGYKLAITTLDNQLEQLDKMAITVKDTDWAASLSPSTNAQQNTDPMAIAAAVFPGDRIETALLYNLFAGHAFNEGLLQLQQLLQLKTLMTRRQTDMQALHDMSAILGQRQKQLPSIDTRIDTAQNRLSKLSERWPILEKRARQNALDNKNTGTAVSIKNQERRYKLTNMEDALAKQADTPASKALKNRVRVLKGLLIMDIASKAPPSQGQIYADIASNGEQMRITKVRMDALQTLLADNQKISSRDNESKVRALEARLQSTQKNLDVALNEHRNYLRLLAENQIEDSRTRINQDLAEAHLSIARLQDAAMIRDDRPSEAPEKPQP